MSIFEIADFVAYVWTTINHLVVCIFWRNMLITGTLQINDHFWNVLMRCDVTKCARGKSRELKKFWLGSYIFVQAMNKYYEKIIDALIIRLNFACSKEYLFVSLILVFPSQFIITF